MKLRLALLAVALVGSAAPAEVPLEDVKARRRVHKLDRDQLQVFYRFEDGGEHVTAVEQAGRRAREAAEAWQEFKRRREPLAVLARSPYGGGESPDSYWPAGAKPELLRLLVEPLEKQGLKVVLADVPPAKKAPGEDEGVEGAAGGQGKPAGEQTQPYPQHGFCDDYEFVLTIGLHREKIPYKGARFQEGGTVVRVYSSRVNAWAILYHAPTGCALWGATSVSQADRRMVADTLNAAAEVALKRLEFSDIGTENISERVGRLQARDEQPGLDLAALLVQTQRADAVEAVRKVAMGPPAFKNSAWVVRWYNQRGVIQDYRVDEEKAKQGGCVLVNQRVAMRSLLMEQLRGVRGVQGLLRLATTPKADDIQILELGQQHMHLGVPACPDDEIVLMTELAHAGNLYDPDGPFRRSAVAAVRNLGKCKYHVDEAAAVARVFASRKLPPPGRGRRPRGDPLKEAGQEAMKELSQARAERAKKVREELRRLREMLE